MEEQLVSFETAKMLKEAGFNIEQKAYYLGSDKELWNDVNFPSVQPSKPEGYISAPTQSLAQKWFREKHKIHIMMYLGNKPLPMYASIIFVEEDREPRPVALSETLPYEETLELALRSAASMVKK